MSLLPQDLILSNPSDVCDGSGPIGSCVFMNFLQLSLYSFESPGQLAGHWCQGVASALLLQCHINIVLPGNILIEL